MSLERLNGFLLLIFLFSGCHAYLLDDAQTDLRKSFITANYEHSQQLLSKYGDKGIYRAKDAVLFELESGTINHFAGNYGESIHHFSAAELKIEDAYSKSISRGLGSILTSDNALVYDGEPYEDIYLNAFNALNYMHLKNWEDALVETRRMVYKMENLDIKIKGMSKAFEKQDTTGKIKWGTGKSNIQNSAFSHYLATILYAKSGKPDDARIEFEKLGTALREQKRLRRHKISDTEPLEQIKQPESYNVLITSFTGRSPSKVQNDVRALLDPEKSIYVKLSLPELLMYPSNIQNVKVIIDTKPPIPLALIEEMDVVSAEVYKAKEPVIYARSLLRASLKTVGVSTLSESVEKKHETLGELIGIFGMLGQEATEKADLRSWQTLPGQVWMNVVKLTSGTHTVRIEYISNTGTNYFEEYEVVITDGTDLELIESIHAY